jgi:hypothetical protein
MTKSRRIGKQLLGTVVAVLAGWITALLLLEATTAIELFQQPHYAVPAALLVGPIVSAWFMAYFVLPVWALILIPLYMFIPSSSILWRWPVCTVCGAAAGLLIVGVVFGGIPGVGHISSGAWGSYILAAIVGGVTCLIGSLTKHIFTPAV